MDYKEKLKTIINSDKTPFVDINTLLKYFPELKKSEDERIADEIIQFLYLPHPQFVGKRNYEEWIAWIKKQGKPNPYSGVSFDYNGHTWGMCARDNGVEIGVDGELKAFLSLEKSFIFPKHPQSELAPKSAVEAIKEEKVDNANKVEPKFKVEKDKWYVCISQFGNCIEGRVYKATSDSRIIDDFGTEYDIHSDAYKYFRLWTIQDAKDGDILFQDLMGGYTFIYNGTNTDTAMLYSFIISNDGEDVLPYHIGKPNTGIGCIKENENIIHPATKEQRDLLFQKMREAGYEWVFEKKKLEKKLPKGEDYGIDGLHAAIDILEKTLGKVNGYQTDDGILEHKCAIFAVKELTKKKDK